MIMAGLEGKPLKRGGNVTNLGQMGPSHVTRNSQELGKGHGVA